MQSLSELIDETPPDRLRDNASPAEKMLRAGATEEAPPTAPPRRLAPSVQDALEAAEHGDARALAAYLEHGGDPAATSRLHHMGWSLLHLAAGCALAGGPGAAQAYRRRPEPDAPGGFARCVELLLAAGAEPAPNDERPAPLAGAVLCGDATSARLLLRAGAPATPVDSAPPGRHTAAEREAMRELLKAPPKLLPRSPLRVEAKLSEYVEGDARERVVEVRWRPPPDSPGVGPVERYVVRGRAVAGGSTNADTTMEFAVGAARAPGAGRRPPRRDFCANEAVDRGVALRRHLNLPPPPCPSTLVHGLAPATTYRFAVSCVCAVDGELRESPPSLRSRPLEVPAVRGPVHKPTFLRVRRGDGVVGSSTPPRRSTRRIGRRASSSRRCSRTASARERRPPRPRDPPRATTPPEPPTRRWTRAGRRRRRCSDPSRGPRRSVC